MQSLQKIEGESRVFRVALWLTFCAAVLAGCSTTQPRLVSPAPLLPSGSPRTAVSFLARRPAKPFIPPPAVTNITLQWLNDNTGNTNVVTGIESSVDLVNWQSRWVTNCDTTTNTVTLATTNAHEFFRAYCAPR